LTFARFSNAPKISLDEQGMGMESTFTENEFRENLIVPQITKKIPALRENRKFSALFKAARQRENLIPIQNNSDEIFLYLLCLVQSHPLLRNKIALYISFI
jgi:hypothetical protein